MLTLYLIKSKIMKTLKNCTQLTSEELILVEGGNTAPSGNATQDLAFVVGYTAGFLKDSFKFNMLISGTLFGRAW